MNLHEDEVKETKADQVFVTEPIATEPEHYPEPHSKINVRTSDQDHSQDVPVSSAPESVPAQEQSSTDGLAPAEDYINSPDLHPDFESQPAAAPNEAEDTPPTSQSVEPPQPWLVQFYFCIFDGCSLTFDFGFKDTKKHCLKQSSS